MASLIERKRRKIADLCRRYGVRRPEISGSLADGTFDPQRSNIDFLVDFDARGDQDLFHRYFGLHESVERLFRRKVDLVMIGALGNPYFIEAVNRTRHLVHVAPVAQTA